MMTNVNGYGKFEQIIDLYKTEGDNGERDKEILRLRFIDGLSCAKIGKLYDISACRVNQIVAKTTRVIKNNVKFAEVV